ncbi:MAG TPA: L-threonylcarbamoyladenylate synthase [Polyangiaceae bacterium]|nr:L-threonylcarbamoyladenylate synthase [Polyangiaceae bacterium]
MTADPLTDDAAMEAALAHLRQGGVVAAPTETFYGLLADATNPQAISALIALKPRDSLKGIGLILPSLSTWRETVTEVPDVAEALAEAFWPGPLTIALSPSANVDSRLIQEQRIAVRLGSPSPAATLAARLGRPVTATSANAPGQPPTGLATDVEAAFAEAIAQGALRVVPGSSPGGWPSTVVTVSGEEVNIARLGAIPAQAIEQAIAAWRNRPKRA